MGVFYALYGHSSVAVAGPTLEYFLWMLRGGYTHLYWEEELTIANYYVQYSRD